MVVDRGEGPEFETVAMFGANLDIYDLEPITEANYLCNRLGLDTISAGGTIAALMEIYGIAQATPPDARTAGERALMADAAEFARACGAARRRMGRAGGRSRRRSGTPGRWSRSCGAMARGEGALGRALASGARRLAERYGHPDAAMAVKGMEIPAYDPRVTWTQAMSYMTTARGGCHLQGGYSAPIAFCAGYGEFPGIKSEGAALVARNFAYQNTAYDVLGVCAFAGFSVTLDEYANMLNDVTGLEMKASDLETVSRRVLTLERLFNLLCGFTAEDDWLPERFYRDPIAVEEGRVVCPEDDFRAMRAEYYESLGWDERGVPRAATIQELGLDAVLGAAEFERMAGGPPAGLRRGKPEGAHVVTGKTAGDGAADLPAHARHGPRDHADARQQHPQREPRPSRPARPRRLPHHRVGFAGRRAHPERHRPRPLLARQLGRRAGVDRVDHPPQDPRDPGRRGVDPRALSLGDLGVLRREGGRELPPVRG